MGVRSGRRMLAAGAQAPAFRLRDLSGAETSLNDLVSAGPVLLVFFKVSCPVCQFALPFLERLRENGRVRIVGISQDDSESTAEFQDEFKVHFQVLLDESGAQYPVSNGFGISQVPSQFQIEADGRISYAWEGFSRADLQALADRVGLPVFRSGERVPELRPG